MGDDEFTGNLQGNDERLADRTPGGGLLWIYTTRTVIAQTLGTHLDAYAYDLADNFGASALELNEARMPGL